LIGKEDVVVEVVVKTGANMPTEFMDMHCKYRFGWEQDITVTNKDERENCKDPEFNYKSHHDLPKITEPFSKSFFNGFVFLSVFGHPISKKSLLPPKN
jgi:hypothetical protein